VARLILESGGERREIKVTGPLTVGRSQTATVYLDDKTLSREHTQFFLQNGRLFVKDLQSKNGTYLNGALLQRAEALKPGDRVKVGVAAFTVAHEAGDALPAVTAPLASPPPRAVGPVKTTVTAPAGPARPRPTLGGPHPVAVFFYRIILLGVMVVVAYLSKGLFVKLIHGLNS
jgi:pSer/pThr/pTyr-binding forkhead associated (FHA) protein